MIPANKQEVFDRAWCEIRTAAWCARRGQCRYLSDDGKKCAIGVFIPDGHPAQAYERGVHRLHMNYPDLFETGVDMYFLYALQACHDESANAERFRDVFETRMRDLAKRYDLTIPGGA